MQILVTSVRRFVWLMLLGAVGGAAYAYWRDHNADDALLPAEWPPVDLGSKATETPSTTTETPAPAWVEPLDDGSCPTGYPIKANDKSGIFHVPDGRFYERTKPERCYADPDAAVADGYRRSKS